MKNIIIIGVGRRVRNDILPALEACGTWNIIGIYARKEREINILSRTYSVKPLQQLNKELIAKTDWIYIGVPPKVVSSVLNFLINLPVKKISLLMDTPVLPWPYLLTKRYFKYFLQTVVADDAIYLPWIESMKESVGGKVTELIFDASAYGYHGIALIKAITGCSSFRKARLKLLPKKTIELESSNGAHSVIIEPRDYANGFMRFSGPTGTITDERKNNIANMKPIISNGLCIGLKVGNLQIDFSPVETKLIGHVLDDATMTSLTLELKRVSLLKMLVCLSEGKQTGRSLKEAISDTRLNELVHHFGRWVNVAKLL